MSHHILDANDPAPQITVFLRDSTSQQGKSGVVAGDISACCWQVDGSNTAPTDITLADSTYPPTYAAGKLAEVSALRAPGSYTLCLPTALLDASRRKLVRLRIVGSGILDDEHTIEIESDHILRHLLGAGKVWYVSAGGNDANPGILDAPKLTLASMSGYGSLASGHAVFIGAGTWTENGALATGVRWLGCGEATIIKPNLTGLGFTLNADTTLERCKAQGIAGTTVLFACGDHSRLRDVHITGAASSEPAFIQPTGSATVLLSNCRLDGAGLGQNASLLDAATNSGLVITNDCLLFSSQVKGSGVAWGGRTTTSCPATFKSMEKVAPDFKPAQLYDGTSGTGFAKATDQDGVRLTNSVVVNAIKLVTDHLATAIELDGAVYRLTQNALELAPTGSGGGAGTGANTVTITVDDGTDPIEGASVRMTNGAQSYLVATNASGQATFNVDALTWTVAITKAGYSFAGASLVVSASAAQTYSMTANAMPTPTEAGQAAGRIVCYAGNGDKLVGATLRFALVTSPATATAGQALSRAAWTSDASDSSGVIDDTFLKGGEYTASLQNGPERKFTVPDTDTFLISLILG